MQLVRGLRGMVSEVCVPWVAQLFSEDSLKRMFTDIMAAPDGREALVAALGSEDGGAALVAALGTKGGRDILLRALRTPAGRGLLQEVLETEKEAVAPVVDALVSESLGRQLAGPHGADLVGRVLAVQEGQKHIQAAVKAEFYRLNAAGTLRTVPVGSLPAASSAKAAQPRVPQPAAAPVDIRAAVEEAACAGAREMFYQLQGGTASGAGPSR